jgi:hypothetical protein
MSSLERREYGRMGPSRWPRDTLYPQKLSLASPTSGGNSVGVVRSRTKAMELLGIWGLWHQLAVCVAPTLIFSFLCGPCRIKGLTGDF